jgi:outer membrane protein TolC
LAVREKPRFLALSATLGVIAVIAGVAGLAGSTASAPSPAAPPEPAGLGLLDAIQLMLEHDPNIALVRTQVRSSAGALLAAAGPFDPLLSEKLTQASTKRPLSPGASSTQRTTESDLGLTKQFRTGFSISPELQLLRTEDGSEPPGAVNQGTLSFTFRQPLLRGRGRAATAAPELAAEREVTAAGLDLAQTTAERIVAVANQYWSEKAAEENLGVLLESEKSSRDLFETTRQLVEADQTPAAELVQLEANLAAKEAARIGGETALFKARQDLGREIGLDAAAIAALPPPTEPFPAVPPDSVPPGTAADRFVAAALARRADLLAARERLAASEILVRAAENAREPQLDLVLTPSYTGLTEGVGAGIFFSPLYRNIPGGSVAFGFSLSWPTLSSRERGALEQSLAARQADALRVELATKEIGADVPTALDAVARSARQLERATAAVRLFERAVVNEEKKLRAGSSTLINVITQRDRLTAARQGEVSAHLALALALLELRFATGTLLATSGESPAVRRDRLTTVPNPQEAAP